MQILAFDVSPLTDMTLRQAESEMLGYLSEFSRALRMFCPLGAGIQVCCLVRLVNYLDSPPFSMGYSGYS